jgi:hypothetical protein
MIGEAHRQQAFHPLGYATLQNIHGDAGIEQKLWSCCGIFGHERKRLIGPAFQSGYPSLRLQPPQRVLEIKTQAGCPAGRALTRDRGEIDNTAPTSEFQ